MFYLICRDLNERDELISFLKNKKINAVFHYICLHDSPYYRDKHDGRKMPNAKKFEKCLVRLPLWVGLSKNQNDLICDSIRGFFELY